MVFASSEFLFFYFVLTFALYFVVPRKIKNFVLLITSLLFYAWGEPVYIVLMCFSILLNYGSGIILERIKEQKWRVVVLVVAVAVNLGLLGVYKYANLFIESLNNVTNWQITSPNLRLPIGISFYTFQAMSYTIDVYRKRDRAQYSLIDFGAFVSMFPQLIAGPIVRYSDVAIELQSRKLTADQFGSGCRRFITGLAKKVLLANNIGALWTLIQKTPIAEMSVLSAWLGILAFAFQIYFDFSGYSDMAIGMGRMMGFNFPENFNYPYISRSITEFWRRWHMTLGTWFRDYVYFPLGGSRKGKWNTVRNLFIVWLLTGFWHGASWNFMLWGVYFGIIIALEKLFLIKWLTHFKGAWMSVIQWLYAFVMVLFGWVLFSFSDASTGISFFRAMFGMDGQNLFDTHFFYTFSTHWLTLAMVILASVPWWPKLVQKPKVDRFLGSVPGVSLTTMVYIVMLVLSVAYLVSSTFNPFLYFQF